MEKRLEFLIVILLLISVNTITAQSKNETEKKQARNSTSVSSALGVVPESFNYVNIPIDEDKSWWNNWPRFTYYSRDVNKVVLTKSSAMTVVHGLADEGRAPFFRDHILVHEPVNTEYIQQLDIKIMAWLEGMGEANTVKWAGTASFVNDPYWQKPKGIPEDMASPWWVERNIYAANYFIEEHNVDGFWIDNYTGWDFMGNNPVENVFGEWTVASFRDYLKDNPVDGETYSADYDVRDALKARFLTHFSSADPGYLKSTVTRANWLNSIWIDDALWRAFKSHKAKIANNSMIRLYEGIKEGATELGKNADNILVSGNDLPSINFGSFKGNSIDISSSEYRLHHLRSEEQYSACLLCAHQAIPGCGW
jgi:hypothetical protein